MNQKYRLLDATPSHDMTLFLQSVCIKTNEKVMIHKCSPADLEQYRHKLEQYISEPPELSLNVVEYFQSSTNMFVVLEDAEPISNVLPGFPIKKIVDLLMQIKIVFLKNTELNHKQLYYKTDALKIYWIDHCDPSILYSPPQNHNKRILAKQTDQDFVWKLGIVYYFCLVGQRKLLKNQNWNDIYRSMVRDIDELARRFYKLSDICYLLKSMLKYSASQRITTKMVEHSLYIIKAKQEKNNTVKKNNFVKESMSFYEKSNSNSFISGLLPHSHSFKISYTRSLKEESRCSGSGPSRYKKSVTSKGFFNYINNQISAGKTNYRTLAPSLAKTSQSDLKMDYSSLLKKLKSYEDEKKFQCLQQIEKLRLSKKVHPSKNHQAQQNISIRRPSSKRNTSHRSSILKSSKRTGRMQKIENGQLQRANPSESLGQLDLQSNIKNFEKKQVNIKKEDFEKEKQEQNLQNKNKKKYQHIQKKQPQNNISDIKLCDQELQTIELILPKNKPNPDKKVIEQDLSSLKGLKQINSNQLSSLALSNTFFQDSKASLPIQRSNQCKRIFKQQIIQPGCVKSTEKNVRLKNKSGIVNSLPGSSAQERKPKIQTEISQVINEKQSIKNQPKITNKLLLSLTPLNSSLSENISAISYPKNSQLNLLKINQEHKKQTKQLLKTYNLLGQVIRFASSSLKEQKSMWMVPCFFVYKCYYGFRQSFVTQIQNKVHESKTIEQLNAQNSKIASGVETMFKAIKKSPSFQQRYPTFVHLIKIEPFNERELKEVIQLISDYYSNSLQDLIKKRTMYMYNNTLKSHLKFVCLVGLAVIIIDQDLIVDQKINPIIFWESLQQNINSCNESDILIPTYTQQLDFKIGLIIKKYKT